ncbi:pupal cuticle protein 36-like [Musca vetustissima]|uniref:pupal cuticle protein 36-like n=1 Tax=Musca vetustissima TaxID=27455 RepID=UPI002AB5FD7A|nr:pupal cuticle protein 36-like [Musca vetustissima]
MRLFLTLCSLAAVALAKPQYNYGTGVSGTFGSSGGNLGAIAGGNFGTSSISRAPTPGSAAISGGSSSFGSLGGGSSFGSTTHGSGSSFSSGPSFSSGSTFGSSGGSNFGSSNFGSSGVSNFGSSSSVSGGHAGFEAPLVHKQFITVSAPEDNERLEMTKHLVIGRPQKNYRVVFIKAPSSSNANVKLSAEYAPQEEKTVIYVLSKNDNNLEVSDIATPAPTVPSKPEIFFIKYKTEEEAQHAQRQIQAEYDKIEGSSEHTDAGIAPQQSVVGILGDSGNAGSGSTGGSIGSFGTTTSTGGSFGSSGLSSTGSIGFGTTGSVGSTTGNKASAYLPPTTTV